MPITSAPIGRNRHMSISHRRYNPFIMAVIARHTPKTDYKLNCLHRKVSGYTKGHKLKVQACSVFAQYAIY